MSTPDYIVAPRWVIPVRPAGQVLENHAVVVTEGRIETILPVADAVAAHPEHELIERPEHALLPGLINAHTHASMTLLRGIADDLPLQVWLEEHIWPAEGAWVSPDFVRDGTRLAIAEMIRGGTTCFNDMYFFPDVIAETAAETGIRCSVGLIAIDIPTPWASDIEEYLHKGLAVHDRFKGHPLITSVFAPHSPYMVSPENLARIAVLTNELDTKAHIHVAETAGEVEQCQEQHGKRPLDVVADANLLGAQLLAVHLTQATDEEIARLGEVQANVVHCPESNLKLASGHCPVSKLIGNGVNVALGTDGAASNNDLDMIGEMRTAALREKGATGDASALPAETVLEMATINGAIALGIAEETGSIEPGKAADLICIDLSAASCQPVYNPVSAIIYAASRDQVSDVWVAGQALMTNRELQTLDEAGTIEQAVAWHARITDTQKEA